MPVAVGRSRSIAYVASSAYFTYVDTNQLLAKLN
jgi:hypothetical protein